MPTFLMTLLLLMMLAVGEGAAQAADAAAGLVAPEGRRFSVDLPSYLSQYDVLYLAPAMAPDEGLPLGNGDLCAAVWNSDTLNFTLNKSDVWTPSPNAPATVADYRELLATQRERLLQLQTKPAMGRWELDNSWHEKRPPRVGSAQLTPTNPYTLGEIAVRLAAEWSIPMADLRHGKRPVVTDFAERLDLHTGTVRLRRGGFSADTYVDEGRGVVVVHLRGIPAGGTREVELWHWDEQQFGAEDGAVWLQRQFADGSGYALAATAAGLTATGTVTEAGHRAVLKLGPGEEAWLYFAAVSSNEAKQPQAAALALARKAAAEDTAARQARHDAYWQRFWTQSYVEFADPYAANLWYLHLYQMGCASRGKYPPRFEGGYWFARGFVHWPGGYWQYNEQMLYWPLDEAGHPELLEPYTRLIRDCLAPAQLYTQAQFGLPGANYAHCLTCTGQPFDGPGDMIKYVLSTGGLYAMYLWQHYQYTGDRQFLRDRAYPVMREVLTFLHGYLQHQVGPDGKYIIYPDHPIEDAETFVGNPQLAIALIHNLAGAIAEAEKTLAPAQRLAPLAAEMVTHLPAYPQAEGYLRSWEDYGATAPFRVQPEAGSWDTLPSWCEFPGGWQGQAHVGPIRNSMGTDLAAVFPVPEISLHSDPALLRQAQDTLLKFNPGPWGQFDPGLILAARLGQRWLVLPMLAEFIASSQVGPQGWMTYMGGRAQYEQRMAKGEDFDCLEQPRYEPYFEPLGNLVTGVNEMLLDSLGGVIHVFPAYPLQGEARFCLRAVGGFTVSSELRGGEIAYVGLVSTRGEPCTVGNPWPGQPARVAEARTGKVVRAESREALLRFVTQPGGAYFVERPTRPAAKLPLRAVTGQPRMEPRVSGKVMLGLPREGWARYSGVGPTERRAQVLQEALARLAPPGRIDLAAAARGAVAWVLDPLQEPTRHMPAYLNDGLYGNEHSAISTGDDQVKGVFRIDLGKVETVASVTWSRDRTAFGGGPGQRDRMATDYLLQVSTDGTTWETVAQVKGNTESAGRRDEFPPVAARYLQMVVQATNSAAPCVDELEVWGPQP
ncbi:MAG TPA: discoidin domain-containing protein [Armatimonadota bacterium]|jgi:hypothetical protein